MSGPMKCRECGELTDMRIIDSRPREDLQSIRRRRVCTACGFRWSTVEVIAPSRAEMPGTGPHNLKLTPAEWEGVASGRTL